MPERGKETEEEQERAMEGAERVDIDMKEEAEGEQVWEAAAGKEQERVKEKEAEKVTGEAEA